MACFTLLSVVHINVIIISETHLLSHIPHSFVSIPDYNLVQNVKGIRQVPKH